MNCQHIIFSLESGIARITLNRPDRLNSFNADMHLELRDALQRIRDGGARVLLLTGAGRGFCAGQDLADRNVSAGAEPVDLGYTKQAIYASGGNSLEQQLDLERASQQELGFGHDYREGVAAFMEKRSPQFTGE